MDEAVQAQLAACAGPMETRLAGVRVPGGHLRPQLVDETGVAAGDIASADDPDAFTLDGAVDEVRVVAELLAACAGPPHTARRGVIPWPRVGYDGAVQLRDVAQTAEGEREGELGDALAPEALAGLYVGAYARGRQRVTDLGGRSGGEDGLPQSRHLCHTLHSHGYVQGDETGDAGRVGQDLTDRPPVGRGEPHELGLTLRLPQGAKMVSGPRPRPVEVGMHDDRTAWRY